MGSNKNDPKNIGKDAFDHLIYLRVFEGCNLSCKHCFIPSNPKKMTVETVRSVPSIVSGFAKPGDKVLLQWHGGEPTAIGPDWFRSLISVFDTNYGFEITHGIQTNLIKYDERWRDIYSEYFNSSIGVSWDPGIRLTRKGDNSSNIEYEELFWKNIENLHKDGIEPYLIITGTKVFFEKYRNPFVFFAEMEDRGIKKVHIERLTKTGYARESWGEIGITNLEWSEYMSRFFRAYMIYSNKPRDAAKPLNVSPFDGLIESVVNLKSGGSGGYGCLSGACDTRFHTVDANGYKFGCTAINSELDNKSSGESVLRIYDLKKERISRQVDCQACSFKKICSSGCMASDKVDASGECSGGFGLFSTINSFISI